MGANGFYVYAVTEASAPVDGLPAGVDGAAVTSIVVDDLAAAVSPIAVRTLRPERRHLAAHQGVLRVLGRVATVLPLSFGMITRNQTQIERFLREHRASLSEQMGRVAGCVEMGLRVAWDVPNIFAYLVERHPMLRVARDRFAAGASHDERMELGRMVEGVLGQERQDLTDRVIEALRPVCAEVLVNDPRKDAEIMNLACLVRREGVEAFEKAVHAAAAGFTEEYVFDFNGPWAPHNFVKLEIDGEEGLREAA
jgi:hypothetical protein